MIEISVIIPTYNRAQQLRICLDALSSQTQPDADFEVVVVDDGSTDTTSTLLETLKTPYTLRFLKQEHSGQQNARNRGAQAARGRYCLFLDDDIVADPNLVTEHLRVQRQHNGVVAIGQIPIALGATADGSVRYLAESWHAHYARLNRGIRRPSWRDCYGGNMSVPRASFFETGGFAVDLPRGEDVELGYRLERHGLPFIYVPHAIGTQDVCKKFRDRAADAQKSGAAWVKLYQRHPPMLSHLFGSFAEGSRREILLQRALLSLNVPPRLLAFIGPALAKRSWSYAWYRFLDNYCYWRGVRQAVPERDTWHRLTHGTPILMYHAFGGSNDSASRYVLPVRRFERQMAWLKKMGYEVISLEELLRCRRENRLPPARSVVITIDDGYADARTFAYPILRGHGFPATIFLVSDSVGRGNSWDTEGELAGRPMLSWSDIRALLSDNIQFGAHTRTHPALPSLSAEQARQEIEGSRADLESKLQVPIRIFAYPYGQYTSKDQAISEQAGFLGSCSVRSGFNTPKTPFHALRRIEIHGTDTLAHFALKLWLGESRIFQRSSNS